MTRYNTMMTAVLCLILDLTPGHVKRILDGDTFALYHVGVPAEERVRVLGVDTPEPGKPLSAEATAFTTTWLQAGPFTLTACKRDGFGRLLGALTRGEDDLAESLMKQGLAVPWKW